MAKREKKIVILGAGPCGIGAAWCLYKSGHEHWAVYERNCYGGGLAASFRDAKGFSWDVGGHVIFARNRTFAAFLDELLREDYLRHTRDAWIRIFDSWVPYPFQSNIHHLPEDKYCLCLEGLKRRPAGKPQRGDFRHWLISNFGRQMAEMFMIPLNRKMWSYPLERMSADWVNRKVPVLKGEQLCKGFRGKAKINADWGPNNSFIYPLRGGVGEVFRRACRRFKDRLKLGCGARRIDLCARKISFSDGRQEDFDVLINTSSLNDFVPMLYPAQPRLVRAAKRLRHSRMLVTGIGLKRQRQDSRSWMYFPESKYPFFRVTNLSNYSSHNLPAGDAGNYSSLLVETAVAGNGPVRKVDRRSQINATVSGLIDAGLLMDSDRRRIVSTFCLRVEQAYPIPTLDREEVLAEIDGFLARNGVFSRGRFGSFRYEDGNMDDCFMQGYAAARQITGR